MKSIIFFRELLKNWRQTGAVMPSSPFLAMKMLEPVNFREARLIVELGPGTGSFTREILSRMHSECRLIVLELNETFCNMLREIRDPRLTVRNISATELSAVLRGELADHIISGLPLAVLEKEVADRIIVEAKNNLKTDGVFVQFQYSLASLKTINSNFEEVRVGFVPINIPPAFVYQAPRRHCIK